MVIDEINGDDKSFTLDKICSRLSQEEKREIMLGEKESCELENTALVNKSGMYSAGQKQKH